MATELVGEWTYENEAIMGPDQPPMKNTGTQTDPLARRLWVSARARARCPTAARRR